MTNPTLQAYRDAHDRMMNAERWGYGVWWCEAFGLYKVARYDAVKAGLIPETPQFDVVSEKARKREALRELTKLTEEFCGYAELKGDNEEDGR